MRFQHFACTITVLAVMSILMEECRITKAGEEGRLFFKKPAEVFKAAQAAAEKKDMETLCQCLTEETVDQMTGALTFLPMIGLGMSATVAKGKSAEAIQAKLTAFEELLARHGLTEKALAKFKGQIEALNPQEKPENMAKAFRLL